MNIDEIKALISEMKVLKDKLTLIVNYIDTAQSHLETPSKKIIDFYTIDDNPIDNNDLASIKDELIEKKERIKNIIIPEIDSKLGFANQNMAQLEEQERKRAEQERLEEENRQRAERELSEANNDTNHTDNSNSNSETSKRVINNNKNNYSTETEEEKEEND